MEDSENQEEGSGSSDESVKKTGAPQAAFRSRMKSFEYAGMELHRRSPRFAASTSKQTDVTAFLGPDKQGGPKRQRVPNSPPASSTTRLKKRRSTPKERSAQDPHSPTNNLVDSLRPNLTLVMIGLNPGLMTAATGHAYAHPSNRFWHILHASGITPKKHIPAETRDLMDLYQIGNTNICARPTRSGDGLTKQEMEEGAIILDEKIAHFRPEAVVIVGKSIWEAIWMQKRGVKRFKDPGFHWGWQDEELQVGRVIGADGEVIWPGARTFVATSTSGLAATLTPAEKLAIWTPLGEWMTASREEGSSTARANGST